jgi:hypothetical protein
MNKYLDYLKTNEATYVVIFIVVILVVYAITLSSEERRYFKFKLITLPVISLILLVAFLLSLYNLTSSIILILGICILLALPVSSSPSSLSTTIEHFDSKKAKLNTRGEADADDDDDADADDDADDDAAADADDDAADDAADAAADAYAADSTAVEDSVPPSSKPSIKGNASKTVNMDNHTAAMYNSNTKESSEKLPLSSKDMVSNYLGNSLGIYNNKYADIFNEAVRENKKAMTKRMKNLYKNNKKHEGSSSNNKKENYSDTNGDLSIARRKFNLNDEVDKDLLNTREICTDVINRINYEYEDKDYLKKYIATRVEEIIEINKLLDD